MATRFIDLEAQVGDDSDDERDFGTENTTDDDCTTLFTTHTIDDEQDGINDHDEEISRQESYLGIAGPAIQPTSPASDFIQDLERRYITSPALGKRKASDSLQTILNLANRPEPTVVSSSFSSSSVQRPNHPLTKARIPIREQPIRIPEAKRLMRGSEWIDDPPRHDIHAKGKPPAISQGEQRRQEMDRWAKWAAKKERERDFERHYAPGQWVKVQRGIYKGDAGQVYKTQMRERSDEEVEMERQRVEEALARGEEPPPMSPEMVFDGYWVLLVPRLPPPTLTRRKSLVLKQKLPPTSRRFDRRLFLPSDYGIQIPEQFRQALAGFEVNGRILSHGLLMKLYRSDALQPISSVDLATVVAFQEHPFSKRFPFPLPHDWEFRDGETVHVAPREGHEDGRGPVRMSEGALCVEFDQDGVSSLHPVTKDRLTKVVDIGNYVEVISGDMAGREGLVVEKRGTTLGVSENGTRRRINFFVHVNCITRTSRGDTSTIPWLEKEVVIVKGPYSGQLGIVKDVKRKPNRDVLFLWLLLPRLQRAIEVEDNRVVTKTTRDTSRDPLWKIYPLTPDQRYFHIERTVEMDVEAQVQTGLTTNEEVERRLERNETVASEVIISMSTGKTPWIGLFVGITHGQHKGYEGSVVDVNRTSQTSCESGLMVEVELNVFGSRRIQILYDFVRERRTGLTLAAYQPLSQPQRFFAPKPTFFGKPARWNRRRTLIATLPNTSVPDTEDSLSDLLLPLDSSDCEHLVPPEDIEDLPLPPVLGPDALPMDVWNPYYEYGWSYPQEADPPPSPPTSGNASTSTLADVSPTVATISDPAHWLSRSELIGISILVDIVEGPFKKKGAYVEPARTPNGAIIVRTRKGKGKRYHDVSMHHVAKSTKDPGRSQRNDDPLLVVISGEHVGKLVRKIHHFFVQAPIPANKWLILAVFDPHDVLSGVTGEVVECSLDELAFVEENYTDSCSATEGVMKELHAVARSRLSNVDVRLPGQGNLTEILASVQSVIANRSSSNK
ncbi:hypothetical protein V5O48_010799 [Marasmius crinis-equi]|uniref:KOW domain-containing protein n=1 Tax=Marasmius crinis-equi TaxID=585013 RepID=A0ABR3F7D4_9AGAR